MKNNIFKSILAGILIGIGSYIYIIMLNLGYKVIGSCLFSLGLISVFLLEANLFTGKIGSIELNSKCIINLLITLLFNFVGIGLVALVGLLNGDLVIKSAEVVASKLSKEWYQILFDSIMCGVMIELAVLLYKKSKNLFTTVLSIMVFILAGFEHCIANLFYYITGYQSFTYFAFLAFVFYILGNSIGAITLHLIFKLTIKEEKQE